METIQGLVAGASPRNLSPLFVPTFNMRVLQFNINIFTPRLSGQTSIFGRVFEVSLGNRSFWIY